MEERWQEIASKVLGLLNLVYFIVGTPLTVLQAAMINGAREATSSAAPYVVPLFLFNVTINCTCLCLLLWTGVELLRLHGESLRLCKWLYISEIVLYATYIALFLSAMFEPSRLTQSFSRIPAIAGGAMGPQFFTAFPIIGLIAVLLIQRRHKRTVEPAQA
jgi:hypothetical protein